MYPYFSFRANERYKTFYFRSREIIFDYLFLFPIAIAVVLVAWLVNPYGAVTLPEMLLYMGFFVLCGVLITAYSLYKVRDYIFALEYEDGVITIDYVHYNTVTRYSGTAADFKIDLKKPYSISRNKNNYLHIESVKHNIVIKQAPALDWSNSKMNDFMYCLKQQV